MPKKLTTVRRKQKGRTRIKRHYNKPPKTIYHSDPNRSGQGEVSSGDVERAELLRCRAMELKIRGYSNNVIARKLQEDFELEVIPSVHTIDAWLDKVFKETVTVTELNAERYTAVMLMRAEEIISELYSIATRRAVVRRFRMRDGEQIEIIDEEAIGEMISAAGEIRKQHEFIAKLLKIGRVGLEKETEGGSSTIHIQQIVNNRFLLPGQKPAKDVSMALVVSSGDPEIDELDSRAVTVDVEAEKMEPGPI